MRQVGIEEILKRYRTVAVVGLSRDPEKASHRVAEYLQKQGYCIVPINPIVDEVLGQTSYKTLLDMPAKTQKSIEVVDVFRPSEDIPPIVDQAVQLKQQHGTLRVIWMQLGIVNQQAAQKAQKAGLIVVMDKCMMMEHERLFGEKEDSDLEKIRAKKMQEMKKTTGSGEEVSAPITVTDADFDQTVKKHPLIVVDCWAEWCGPCRMIAPVIEELAKEHAGEIVFGKLNVDENPETATKFNVMGIPTLLIMKHGAEVDRIVGVAPKLLIENKLKKHV
ncbi:MAG: thioredoxin [Candidatus Bathyarchaeota archaeon]|nr:thioredoxin [Candidatus Bathyarchaeota archaeon]